MENKINNASLNFTCDQDWNTMEQDTEGRFCNSCQKRVYDMTDKNLAYFISIMDENNNMACGRFTRDQMAPAIPVYKHPWKRWAVAALVFIGIGSFAQKTKAQGFPLGKVVPTPAPDFGNDNNIMGDIVIIEQPIELRSLHQYLLKHCHAPTSTNGRLLASFYLKKDGSLTKIALSEQLPINVRQEVLRVMKQAPKWATYKQAPDGQAFPFSLSLNFIDGRIQPMR